MPIKFSRLEAEWEYDRWKRWSSRVGRDAFPPFLEKALYNGRKESELEIASISISLIQDAEQPPQ